MKPKKDYWGTLPFDLSKVPQITATGATPQLVVVTTGDLTIVNAGFSNGQNVYYIPSGFDFYPTEIALNAEIATVPCSDTYLTVKVGISDTMALTALMVSGNDSVTATINPAFNTQANFNAAERFYISGGQNGQQIKVFYVSGTDDVIASVTLMGYLVKKA